MIERAPLPVRWLRTALANLDHEAEFIARDDPDAAARIVATVLHAVETLVLFPNLGRTGRLPGTRELVVPGTPFLVPYRVRHGAVEILRVFHARHRPPAQTHD